MKRVFLVSIAVLAMTASAATAQPSSTSVSGAGPSGTDVSSSQATSSSELINTAGSIGTLNIGSPILPDFSQIVPGAGAPSHDPIHPSELPQAFGSAFGEDTEFGCAFATGQVPDNCAANH